MEQEGKVFHLILKHVWVRLLALLMARSTVGNGTLLLNKIN